MQPSNNNYIKHYACQLFAQTANTEKTLLNRLLTALLFCPAAPNYSLYLRFSGDILPLFRITVLAEGFFTAPLPPYSQEYSP